MPSLSFFLSLSLSVILNLALVNLELFIYSSGASKARFSKFIISRNVKSAFFNNFLYLYLSKI